MSSRDAETASAIAAALALAALLAALFAAPARADDAATAEACLKADTAGAPPAPALDCTDYQARLEQQAKRIDFLAKIKAAKRQLEEADKPADAKAAPGAVAVAPPPPPPPGAGDRTLEVFGDQARVIYQGAEMLVREGQTLPPGARVERVSLDGVTLREGQATRGLPFLLGGRP